MWEHFIPQDSPAGRAELEQQLEQRRAQEEGADWKNIRRGWCLGSGQFREELLAQAHRLTEETNQAGTRRETTEAKARRILQEELDRLGWTEPELAKRSEDDERKVQLARRLRAETSMTWQWIGEQLHLGNWRRAASRLAKLKPQPDGQNEFKLE